MIWLVVFLGGGLGTLLRFGTGKLCFALLPLNFPIGTLVSNLLSCLIIGIAIGYFKHELDKNALLYYFLVVGVCGGFSTFSTFSYESLSLFQSGMILYGVLNILTSLGFCITLIWFLIR